MNYEQEQVARRISALADSFVPGDRLRFGSDCYSAANINCYSAANSDCYSAANSDCYATANSDWYAAGDSSGFPLRVALR